jgi:prepilin-type N-terminal cleavage/methylation domain-containing protein
MANRRKTAGFTLIELMIVVTVIAVVAGAAAPAIGAGIRNRKASTATLDVARAFRVARSSAAGYGVAYMVSFDESADDGRGALRVTRGDTNRCNSVDWTLSTLLQVDEYKGSAFADDDDWQIRLRAPESKLQICYEPTGLTFSRVSASDSDGASSFGRFSSMSPIGAGGTAAGGWVFRVDRVEGGHEVGVRRQVVVPLGGEPRVMLP